MLYKEEVREIIKAVMEDRGGTEVYSQVKTIAEWQQVMRSIKEGKNFAKFFKKFHDSDRSYFDFEKEDDEHIKWVDMRLDENQLPTYDVGY